jgi:hypothetical protein
MPQPIQYGFLQHADLMNQPVTEQNIPIIDRAIRATVAEHTRQLDAMLGLFSEKTTKFKFKFRSVAMKKLQDLDLNGRARATSGAGFYDVAFPIMSGGDAWGANYVASQKLKVQDVNDWLYATLVADKVWLAEKLLIAIFANTTYKFDDPEHGELTVYPLANGDAQEYLIRMGQQAGTTDNHLLFQAAAISDAANPFRAIRKDLIEHPENGGAEAAVMALIPTALTDDVENLTGFKEPPDWDLFPSLNESFLVATLTQDTPGIVKGKVENVWIVEWPTLPDTHLIAVPFGANGQKALAQREHEEASLQGFFELPRRSDTPYEERQFQRHTGFGGNNRVGALVMQIGAGAYSVPAGYEAPVS